MTAATIAHAAHTEALEAALTGAARGWRVIPVHRMVTPGMCSCGNKCEPGSRGKHPRGARWQDRATTDRAQIMQWAAQWPGGNFGFVTGPESGLFVLDVDRAADGSPLGEHTLAELEGRHSLLPDTHTTATGGDGRQFYFTWPARVRRDGRPWANSAKRLGLGLDTRGHNGMVVVAGSRSWKGAYSLIKDAPLADVPDWLLDELEREPQKLSVPSLHPVPRVPVGRSDDGMHPWVRSVFATKVADFRALTSEGHGRTNLLTGRAKYLSQLANQPDTGLTEEQVREALLEAAEANGFVAVKGRRYVEQQIDNGIRDGRLGEPRHWAEARARVPAQPRRSLDDDTVTKFSELYRDSPESLDLLVDMGVTGRQWVRLVVPVIDEEVRGQLDGPDPSPTDTASTGASVTLVAPMDELGEEIEQSFPKIIVRGRPLRDLRADTLAALRAAEVREARMFSHGDHVVVVGPTKLQALGAAGFATELSERADFVVPSAESTSARKKAKQTNKEAAAKGGEPVDVPDIEYTHVEPPATLVKALLESSDSLGIPTVERVMRTPFFAPDGTLQEKPGYHPGAKAIYLKTPGITVPTIPADPTDEQVADAKRLLMVELLGQFPFVSRADLAGAMALGVSIVVRPMIDGPAPGVLFDAPGPGTGKGLAQEAIVRPLSGGTFAVAPAPTKAEEWSKTIFAALIPGPTCVVFDNVAASLDSGALASALTAWPHVANRALGGNEYVMLPPPAAWAITANNAIVSSENARRLIHVRLDAGVERPAERTGFRHADLRAWFTENTGRIVAAWITLARAWISAGKPVPDDLPAFGSYEAWIRVVGSILRHVGIDGLLENRHQLVSAMDTEARAAEGFVHLWLNDRDQHRMPTDSEVDDLSRSDSEVFGDIERVSCAGRPVTATELVNMLEGTPNADYPCELRANTPKGRARELGAWLRTQVDKPIAGYRLKQPRLLDGRTVWELDKIDN